MFYLFAVAWAAALVVIGSSESTMVGARIPTLVIWWVSILILNLLPVSSDPLSNLAPDVPVLIAAALVLTPAEAAVVATAGTFDMSELRGETNLAKALYNHSQIGLGTLASSASVHALVARPSSLDAFPLAGLALLVGGLLSASFVVLAMWLQFRYGLRQALTKLRIGSSGDFSMTLFCWAVLGASLTVLYRELAGWSLVAFLCPTILTRQVLLRSERLIETSRAYKRREQALLQLGHRIAEERSDERRMIAADLHDEVLQPLFKVTLMANVLKADLARGRLLDLDQDLPELLMATEAASSSLRQLVGDLRSSSLGTKSLPDALGNLIRRTERSSIVSIDSDIATVHADPSVELVVYQIAKEALANAIAHSRAKTLKIQLGDMGNEIILRVVDDGIGFDQSEEKVGHYGLAIMKERASSLGGHLYIDSAPGLGTSVTAILPGPETMSSEKRGSPGEP